MLFRSAAARRPSVIWLSFQECTGCTESLTRSHAPTVESLIFDAISLDYHHTLQVAAGEAADLTLLFQELDVPVRLQMEGGGQAGQSSSQDDDASGHVRPSSFMSPAPDLPWPNEALASVYPWIARWNEP